MLYIENAAITPFMLKMSRKLKNLRGITNFILVSDVAGIILCGYIGGIYPYQNGKHKGYPCYNLGNELRRDEIVLRIWSICELLLPLGDL